MIEPARARALFDAHAATLLLYARGWLSAGEAEDAVQDAFLKLMSQGLEPAVPRAWLFRVVRNGAMTRLRSRGRPRLRPSDLFELAPPAIVEAREVEGALADLPADEREIVVLRVWGELKFEDIAGIAGKPLATTFRIYRSALATMRERLEQPCRKT